ncbi:MAG: heme-binding protein, partial [Clostridia bacterium]|nr:heme-binding protein [Clostridia bacterium]
MNEQLMKKTVDAIVNEYVRPTDDMTLAAAQILCEKVRKKAKELGVKAVVAVTNKGGNPVLVECSDGSFIASYDIALNKAYTVVSLKMTTKELSKLASPGGSLYGIQFTNGGRIVIFGGGEPLRNKNGEIIGGLGVSGGTEEQDTK